MNWRMDHLQFTHVELDMLRFGSECSVGEHHVLSRTISFLLK